MRPKPGPAAGSAEFLERMRRVGVTLRRSGGAAVYLIHGTFVGRAVFGFVEALGRVMPDAAKALDRSMKRSVDAILGDVGNYTDQYARRFQQWLVIRHPCP